MSPRTSIDPDQVHAIRQVLTDVRDAVSELDSDDCDKDDLAEVIDRVEAELDMPQPKVATLETYLNSLARSLRAEPRARTVVMELDAVMRASQVPTNWEH